MAQEYIEVDENHRLGWGYDEGSGSDSPREWSTPVGFITIKSRSNYNDVTEVHPDPTGRILEAHEHFDEIGYPKWDPNVGYQRRRRFFPEPEEITERWARIFHGLTIEYDAEYQGYWFIDPDDFKENWTVAEDGTVPIWEQNRNPDGSYASGLHEVGRQPAVELQKEIIDGERKQYRAWAEGNVFYVFAQKRVIKEITVKEVDGSWIRQFKEEEWETEDSLGGIYADDFDGWLTEKEVLEVAKENFPDEYTRKEATDAHSA